MSRGVRVGLIGSRFITSVHAEALKACRSSELFAVASPTPGHAEKFAQSHGIPHQRQRQSKAQIVLVAGKFDCLVNLDGEDVFAGSDEFRREREKRTGAKSLSETLTGV